MQVVQWQLAESPNTTYGFRVVDAQHADAPWVFFFTSVGLGAYPPLIEAAVQGVGYGSNAVGVTFPADLDEGDIAERGGELPADAVEVYHHDFGSTVMPQATFYTILKAVASRLLAQPDQPAGWYEAMREALRKLQAKLS